MKVKNLDQARNVLKDKNNLRNGSIALAFQKVGQEIITYPTTPPTNLEVHVNHVKWMAESHRAFAIVDDKGYHRNMKSGRPHQYIPTADTVSRDVRYVFIRAREKIARLLNVSCQ